MDIFFQDPNAIPLPPGQVRILDLQVQPWPDGRRVRVYLELTPFLRRPNGELSISNALGAQLASISIIETMVPKMEFTLHLRGGDLAGPFRLDAEIFYLETPEGMDNPEDIPPDQRTRLQVDQRQVSFEI